MEAMYESYEKYGNAMENSLRRMSAIQSIALGKKLTESEVGTIKEFKCVQDFLDAPNNSEEEANLKKLFIQAIIAGQQTGTLPFELPEDATPESIASIVDEGLTQIKVAYQLENGLITDEVEAQKIIDEHQAVRTATFTEMAVEKGIELADLAIEKGERVLTSYADYMIENSDILLTAAEAAFPQAAPVIEVAKTVLKTMEPQIKEVVHEGIKVLGQTAKSLARSAIEQLPSVFEKAKQWLLA